MSKDRIVSKRIFKSSNLLKMELQKNKLVHNLRYKYQMQIFNPYSLWKSPVKQPFKESLPRPFN